VLVQLHDEFCHLKHVVKMGEARFPGAVPAVGYRDDEGASGGETPDLATGAALYASDATGEAPKELEAVQSGQTELGKAKA